jgi:hypothetical protein
MTGAKWRVGDAERDAVAGQLKEHYAAGRLTMDEFRARLDAAYAAVTAGELSRVTADLPGAVPAGPVSPGLAVGAAPGSGVVGGGTGNARRYRAAGPPGRRRWRRPAALLIFAGLVAACVLALGSLPHGGLLVLAFLLVGVPVALLTVLAGALIWIGRRAWRSGAWLELVPVVAGVPWLGRVIWLARAVLVGRAFWRAGERVSRPLRSRRAHRPYHGHGYAQYPRHPDGPWYQARVGDLSGTTR